MEGGEFPLSGGDLWHLLVFVRGQVHRLTPLTSLGGVYFHDVPV